MAGPFGATDGFSQAFARGASAGESMRKRRYYDKQEQDAERKRVDEEKMQNAAAYMQDPEISGAMRNPENRRAYYQQEQFTPAQGQAVSAAADVPWKKEIKRNAVALLLTGDDKTFKHGAKMFYEKLPEDLKEKFGNYEDWTREGVAMAADLDLSESRDIHKTISERYKAEADLIDAKRPGGKSGATSKTVQDVNFYMGTVNPETGKPFTRVEAMRRVEENNMLKKLERGDVERVSGKRWGKPKASLPPEAIASVQKKYGAKYTGVVTFANGKTAKFQDGKQVD